MIRLGRWILAILLFMTDPTRAGWISDQLMSYNYDLGVAIPSAKITVEGVDDSGNPLKGVLIGQFLPRPIFAASSQPHYLGNSRVNYNYMFSFVWSNLDEQEIKVSGKTGSQRLGTSGDAYSIYVMPALAYTFGHRQFVRGKGWNARLGLGVGAGWLIASGDVLMTTTTPSLLDLHREFNINSPAVAATGFLDLRWRAFGLGFLIDGPNVTSQGYKYNFLNLALRATYTYSPSDFLEKESGQSKSGKRPKKKKSRWTGDIVATGGSRSLPITGSDDFDLSKEKNGVTAAGGGLLIHFKKEHWPLGIVIDSGYYQAKPVSATTQFFDATAVSKTAVIEGWTSTINLGFRNTWRFGKVWQPFVGGGFTTFFSGLEGTIDGNSVKDSAVAFGFYLGGGMNFVFKRHYTLGFEARMFNGTTELLNAREDLQGGGVNAAAGWHF